MILSVLLVSLGTVGERLTDSTGAALARAFTDGTSGSGERAGILVLVGVPLLVAGVVGIARSFRGRSPRLRPGIDPRNLALPAGVIVLSTVVGALVIVAQIEPVLAAAARSVDASPAALSLLWIAWARRVAVAALVVVISLGLLEWLVSRLRLWHALHLTPAQQRELARERPRKPRAR